MKGYVKLSEIGPTQNTIHRLRSLNIKVYSDGMISVKDIENNGPLKALIKDKVATEPFFMGLSNKRHAILGLAITQEMQNSHIHQEDINFVNFVFCFDKPITFEQVQEYNRKYI
jgi:hypothetical protein